MEYYQRAGEDKLVRDQRTGGVQVGILPEVRRGQDGERPKDRRCTSWNTTRGQERTSWKETRRQEMYKLEYYQRAGEDKMVRDQRTGGVQVGILPEVKRGQDGERPKDRRCTSWNTTRGQERTRW